MLKLTALKYRSAQNMAQIWQTRFVRRIRMTGIPAQQAIAKRSPGEHATGHMTSSIPCTLFQFMLCLRAVVVLGLG